jgi:hypothetical protein
MTDVIEVNLENNERIERVFTPEEAAFKQEKDAAILAQANEPQIKIRLLESFISERRKREALLGNAEAIAFIQGVEDDITIERAKL